jgi:hypothetical protein
MSIRHAGHSPFERVWDSSEAGREVKASITLVEGDARIIQSAVPVAGKQVVTIETKTPAIITVRTMYPKYFDETIARHDRRISMLRRKGRFGRVRR